MSGEGNDGEFYLSLVEIISQRFLNRPEQITSRQFNRFFLCVRVYKLKY